MAGLNVSAVERPCPLCASADHTAVGLHDRNGEDLRTVMCRACGHVFTNPAPNEADLNSYYSERYRSEYKGVITPKRKHVLRAGLRAMERLQRLHNWCKAPAKVLDVGAGGGEFAYLLKCAGYDVTGIEPNAGYARFAAISYGLNIHATTLELVDHPPAQFDTITIHHVLEHLPEPRASLKKLHGWLKPHGLVVVEVPNVLSWFHAPHRRFHAAHLHAFNLTGLTDLLLAAGFAIDDAMVMPGTAHLNIVAHKADLTTAPAKFRNAGAEINAHFERHTEFSHVLSGMALSRLWGNAKRPLREWWQLRALGNPVNARDILDAQYRCVLKTNS